MMYKKLILFVLVLGLTSCSLFGSYYDAEPIGVGRALNELKLSPCSCLQVELINSLPDWFVETI